MRPWIPIMLLFLAVAMLARAEGPTSERVTIYSPVGKRDPFKAPTSRSTNRELGSVSPLERFPVERFELKAVLRGLGPARAMVADPEGGTHIVKQGDRLGRERAVVSKILNTEVIVTERTFNYLGEETLYEKVLSLPAEEVPAANDKGQGRAPGGGIRGLPGLGN
jgi:Tfp pilus assembly protein PilP